MTDAFDALRSPARPVAPDPAFAAALRARLERALLAPPDAPTPEGAAMQLVPYLSVQDAPAAIAWYERVFDARVEGEPILMADGRIGHADLVLGGARLMLAEEFPEADMVAPVTRGGVSQSQHLTVDDPDAVCARAVDAGGVLERPVTDSPYGRTGVVRDPSGHRWMVQRADASPPPSGPSLGYVTIGTPDADRLKAFYGAVLGWTYEPGSIDEGFQVLGTSPPMGLYRGADGHEVQLCYRVDDVAAGVARVRAAGGTAQEPSRRPSGVLAECVDDQGVRFQLWQP